MNSSFPERFRIAFSPKQRKQVVAVFTRVIRQGDPGKRRGGGKQVGRANGFIGERGLDGTRPACDKRNPMTPFVDIRLMTAVNVARVVAYPSQFLEVGLWRTTVIAGENDQRIAADPFLFQRGEDLPHHMVHLQDKIPIEIRVAHSQELRVGKNGGMRGRQGKVKKERTSAISLPVNVLNCLPG